MYDAVHDRLTLCAEHNSAAVCSCIYLPGAWCVTSEEAETQSQLFFHTCTALSFIYLRVCSLIFLCRVVVTDRWPKLRSRGRKLGKNRKRKTMPPTESTSLTLSFLCKRLCAARCEHRNGVHTSQYTRRNNEKHTHAHFIYVGDGRLCCTTSKLHLFLLLFLEDVGGKVPCPCACSTGCHWLFRKVAVSRGCNSPGVGRVTSRAPGLHAVRPAAHINYRTHHTKLDYCIYKHTAVRVSDRTAASAARVRVQTRR